MGPVRVIGRIDLAEQVAARLRGVGVEARVFTGTPMAEAALATMGLDDTVVDVVVEDFMLCDALKRTPNRGALVKGGHLHRPVVFLADPSVRVPRSILSIHLLNQGPDAWLHLSASGQEILAACERALRSASSLGDSVRRAAGPLLLVVAFGLECAGSCSNHGAGTPATHTLVDGLTAVILVLMAFEGWQLDRFSRPARWKLAVPSMLLIAGIWTWFSAGKWLLVWIRG